MPIDPVKIPQNVYIEDRIVGPLTLRQIIIMALGGGLSYMLYASYQKTVGVVGIPMTIALWAPAVIATAFALVNINDLSLLRICFLLAERMVKPGRRIWTPRQGISINIHFSTTAKEEAVKKETGVQKSTEQQIHELSTVVDRAPVASPVPSSQEVPQVRATEPEPQTIAAAPVQNTVATPDAPAATRPPVDPSCIAVDSVSHSPAAQLSDLSVFRDVFTPKNPTWQ